MENALILYTHEWPRQNFSLQYQNNIKQTSDENEEMYQLGDVLDNPIPTNIIRIEWHTVKVITNDILGVKGLRSITPGKFIQSACNLHNVIILSALFNWFQFFVFPVLGIPDTVLQYWH